MVLNTPIQFRPELLLRVLLISLVQNRSLSATLTVTVG